MIKFFSFFNKFIKSKNVREINKIHKIVEEINLIYPTLKDIDLFEETNKFKQNLKLKTEDISNEISSVTEKQKTNQNTSERSELKEELNKLKKKRFEIESEYLKLILPRTFALVKEACRRLCGMEFEISNHKTIWNMIPYNVQLIGAVILHRGNIAEMATGEGKTLVATMPLYLNALCGHGIHLVTVNDYLARRDSEWMGKIFELLGVSIGCIQNSMDFSQRKEQYSKDITYGTNNEFGFDYLRDNIAIRPENRVQREHYFCIVDEVDSVLIDEARTPLIISGLVETDKKEKIYQLLNPSVEKVIRLQNTLINQLITEAEKLLEKGEEFKAGEKLLIARNGSPKFKRLSKIQQKTGIKSLINDTEKKIMIDDGMSRKRRMSDIMEELYFSIDEKGHSINISDKGRKAISPNDPEFFTLPDLSIILKEIEVDISLSQEEKLKKEEEAHRTYADKSEKIHAINQLLRAYSLYNKDDEYVVVDKKVQIVDEFTGRVLAGRRYSDGLHQALQAKENVPIESETQVIATITIQNYFKMYTKLSGMTGTAETESHEFHKIYDLFVFVIPTNEPIRRIDYNDKIYLTKREKYTAIINEIERLHKDGKPILVGTVSVDSSEMLSRMLKRKGINHDVLNAKHHQREAEIVANAGKMGRVTIATNMAGRGTDIKLGDGVLKSKEGCLIYHNADTKCEYAKSQKECKKDMPCGLHIIGTTRHESRRIDRQLRGRSGRQGDPGASRFYLSLEDDLMRLFGSEKIAKIMDRMGHKEGDVIENPLVTRTVENSQKKVEAFNFDIRQRVLKYDTVLNEQRNFVYELRNIVLEGWDLKGQIVDKTNIVAEFLIDEYLDEDPENWDWNNFQIEIARHLGPIRINEETTDTTVILSTIIKKANEFYNYLESLITPEKMREIERYISLIVIDDSWREHLYEMDALREGIGLRGYAQRDPLVEYTIESQKLFNEMLFKMDIEIIKRLYHPKINDNRQRKTDSFHTSKKNFQLNQNLHRKPIPTGEGKVQTIKRKYKKPGRNNKCPCGSGKKFKDCHGLGNGLPKNQVEERMFILYFENPDKWEKETGIKLKRK